MTLTDLLLLEINGLILSDVETEVWNFTTENHKFINSTLQNSRYALGVAVHRVPFMPWCLVDNF